MMGLIKKFLARKAKEPIDLELEDIQGIILSGYAHLPHSRYLFLKVEDPQAAKAWLGQSLPHITSAQWRVPSSTGDSTVSTIKKPFRALNIALTFEGVQALGGSETLTVSFPPEFQQGMMHPERSRRIGDFEGTANHPSQWEDYWQQEAVHILVLLNASQEDIEAFEQEQLEKIQASGLSVLACEHGYLPSTQREHFGFLDAISQPTVEGSPQARKVKEHDSHLTKAGEFVLGYLNEDGNYPQTPFVHISEDITNCLSPLPNRSKRDFGRNGSYLVYRKMVQDVAGFRRYIHDSFETPEEGYKMAAKMVGRWPSGISLVDSPDHDPGVQSGVIRNDFGYRDRDPHGARCPFAAHVRRMNPRDSLGDNAVDAFKAAQRRRILRRGTLFGDPLPEGQLESDGIERGLHFFCLNTSIRRQFEFIQQSWVNNPKFHGLYEERDPLIGMNPDGSNRTMTVPDESGVKTLSMPNFVAVRGGAYFFVPSLSALKFLTRL